MLKKHRGRFQAQGSGTEKSVSWAQDDPLTKGDGLKLLDELEMQLTQKERKLREKQLEAARRFVENAQGVDAPRNKTFRNFKEKNVRIDIEINGGTAFVCVIVVSLLVYLLLNL